MTYPMTYHLMLNYLLIIHLCFLWPMMQMYLQGNDELWFLKKWAIGLFERKWVSIQMLKNNLKVTFSRKIKKTFIHRLFSTILLCLKLTIKTFRSYLRFYNLGVTLTFDEHVSNVFNKVNKTKGLLRKLQNLLPRTTLMTVYTAFVRPHLDYGNILYDHAFKNYFHVRLKSFQCNACLAITGAIRDISNEKLY